MVEDIGVGREDAVRQPVLSHELLDILDWIEFRALGRQRDYGNVGRHGELFGQMPSGLAEPQRPAPSRSALDERPGVIEVDLQNGARMRVDAIVNERALRRVSNSMSAC